MQGCGETVGGKGYDSLAPPRAGLSIWRRAEGGVAGELPAVQGCGQKAKGYVADWLPTAWGSKHGTGEREVVLVTELPTVQGCWEKVTVMGACPCPSKVQNNNTPENPAGNPEPQ